jgi:hypothetical protein
MATSGSYNFSLTAAQLIYNAAENIGIVAAGETINSNHEASLLRRLNMIVKELQGTADGMPGIKIWTRQRLTLLLAKGQQTYSIGPASSDARASTQVGRTTIDAAEASGQTTISVTATTDTTSYPGTTLTMTASDFIGVEQDDGTIHWSTVSSVAAGDTVTIADATSAAAAVGNYVWWFTSRAQRFPVCESAVLRDEDFKDVPLDVYADARQYDMGVADKQVDGVATCILVEPVRAATRVTLNAQPTDVTDTVVLTVLYPAEDYDSTSNDIAAPQEWLGFLEWELTLRGCPMFGREFTPTMKANYDVSRSRAFNLNPEMSVLYFQPNA